jgi:hypothetical protein
VLWLVTVELFVACVVVFAGIVAAGIVLVRAIGRLLYGRWPTGPLVVLGALVLVTTSGLGWFPPGWLLGAGLLVLPITVPCGPRRIHVIAARKRD